MTFWDIILSIFWFMLLFAWIWLLITIFADIFRDHEFSGSAGTALWVLFIIVVPWLGALVLPDRPGPVDERRRRSGESCRRE